MLSFADAEAFCSGQNGATLASILSQPEQDFLADYLFTKHHTVDNVWLGAKCSKEQSAQFRWADGSSLETVSGNSGSNFTNWAPGSPKKSGHSVDYCLQMQADELVRGKWVDEPCTRKNLALCQRPPRWTLAKLQQTLINVEKLQEKLAKIVENGETAKKIEQFQSSLTAVENNLVPLGFIYVQLPKEKSPAELWPKFQFTEISSTYEGVFFRVLGKGSAEFGAVQAEFAPHIDRIYYDTCELYPSKFCGTKSFPTTTDARMPLTGGWSGNVVSAKQYDYSNPPSSSTSQWTGTLAFHGAEGSEVRPRNMAVKVWKRTG